MYKISVPVINSLVDRMGREGILESLRALNADRVFLASGSYIVDEKKRAREMEIFKENVAFFKKAGLEVGAWIWTFMIENDKKYTHITAPSGAVSKDQCCPSDEEFVKFSSEYIQDIAKTGVELIMFDDDFRFGYLDCGLGCVCKNHLKEMERILGESLEGKNLVDLLLKGKPNKYRSAWIDANGVYMKSFARSIRNAVNEIDKNIRVGLCSCMTLWDHDGVTTFEISEILAGDTKPFMRQIGAPYWAVNKNWGNRLQHVIELERMERSFVKNGNIEVFSEGDAWPRPRHNCPSSYLEIFDTALRADGKLDGILKYGIDYFADAHHEEGYIRAHQKDKAAFDFINKHFADKESVGIRVYERLNKVKDLEVLDKVAGSYNVQDYFFSFAARNLADNSIPTVYDGYGSCGIAFDVNVTLADGEAMKRGMIIDLRAAEILKENGIDVGLTEVGEKFSYTTEKVLGENVHFRAYGEAYKIKISDKAKVESIAVITEDDESVNDNCPNEILSYTYENELGYKFLVLANNGYFANEMSYRTYGRSREIERVAREFFGTKLPAYSYGNPDLYIQAKKNEKETAVGMWNCFADCADNVCVELDEKYKKAEFFNCTGRLKGDKLFIESINPFAFAAVNLKK